MVLPLLLIPMVLLPAALAPPAQASGFMTDGGPFEVQAGDQCAGPEDYGCVEVATGEAMELWSYDTSGTEMTWISQAVTSPYIVNFVLSFAAEGESRAFYQVGNGDRNEFSFLESSSFTVSLNTNETLTFGVANNSTSNPQQLSVGSFEATAVPAPLPLLGAGAAFGIIRRRRARLRAAAQAQ